MSVEIIHLTGNDVALLQSINAMFGEAFNDQDSYARNKPSSSYLQKLLSTSSFIALAAVTSKKSLALSPRMSCKNSSSKEARFISTISL